MSSHSRVKELSSHALKLSNEIAILTDKIVRYKQTGDILTLQSRYDLLQQLYGVICNNQKFDQQPQMTDVHLLLHSEQSA